MDLALVKVSNEFNNDRNLGISIIVSLFLAFLFILVTKNLNTPIWSPNSMKQTSEVVSMYLGQYKVDIFLRPFSFSITHNSREVLSSIPKNDLALKSFKESKDEVTLNFLDSSGNELTLNLKLASNN
ncbi:MAG: hypothetical protein ACP5HX_09435, partial [Thermoproteota archaeon]